MYVTVLNYLIKFHNSKQKLNALFNFFDETDNS
jgi:hypothetical protein